MPTNLWFWIAFNAGALCLLGIDLFGFQRRAHVPSRKEAVLWTAAWVAISLGFNALIWLWEGHAKALEFLTGYLVEYSLSIDNIFVFVLLFSYFAVPAASQHRVLFWGVLSALIFRGVMIGVGVAIILFFIGAKLLLADVCQIPTTASLGVIGLVSLVAIGPVFTRKPSTSSDGSAYYGNRAAAITC